MEMAEENQEQVPLSMDAIMKMLFRLSDKLTVRMINSLFGKNIPLDAKVIPESEEIHRFSQAEQGVEELRVDIILNISGERFHIEFQSVNDTSMAVRMFEYGFAIAIREVKSYITDTGDGIRLDYPKQYVIFVEQNDSIPEHELMMKVTLWDGDVKEYRVPLMRYWTETVDSLGEKGLEPLLPLQIFKLRKGLEAIAKSKKPEAEKEKLTEAKLREMVGIYTEVTEKIRDLTDREVLTIYNAKEMLEALQHFSEYLYSRYRKYDEIESEAVKVSESKWSFITKSADEGKKIMTKEMFLDGENIEKIKKYSKLPDKDLVDVLRNLPQEIQTKYGSLGNLNV